MVLLEHAFKKMPNSEVLGAKTPPSSLFTSGRKDSAFIFVLRLFFIYF